MSPDVGYVDYKGTGHTFDGLASQTFTIISITVDGGTRDSGNITTDDLRAGFALEIDSTSEHYVEFIDDHDSLVILAEPLYDLATNGHQVASAFWIADFKKGAVIEPATITWSSAQRFKIRADY